MKYNIRICFGKKSHKIEWEKNFLLEDFIYLIDSVFELDNQNFLLADENGC